MNSSAVPSARAPLTRRQIREAERGRGAERSVRSGTADLVETVSTPPLPPSRRELRESTRRRPPSRTPRAGHSRRAWVPRAAVLGALGALTIAAPLTGFAGPEQVSPAAARPAVVTETSILATLADATASAERSPASALMAAPAAADRALVRTSRSAERSATTCEAVDGARGTRAALREEGAEIVMPIASGAYRLTSSYGVRSDPFTGGAAEHTGSDFAAPTDTPIYAVADGTVIHAGLGKDGRSSMLVIIEHEVGGERFYSWYGHMYPEGVHVEKGQQVEAGDVIGGVGSNGRSTGPHLHLEIHLDEEGSTTDALAWLKDRAAKDVSELC